VAANCWANPTAPAHTRRIAPSPPAEIHTTIFAALGYEVSNISYESTDGRPVALTEGTPIAELF
jgi:hypothetical protein